MNKIKSIVFDFDGTLHNTMKIYQPAFASGVELLQEKGFAKDFSPTASNIKKFLGEKPDFAYNQIAKDAPRELIEKAMHKVGTGMEDYMDTVGKLYPGTIEVLEKLYENYDLYILSNCRIRYLEKALDAYNIRKYFKDYYTGEAFKYIPKEDILRGERKHMKEGIIFVGDRYHDIMAAVDNEIPSVFARYGFGAEEEGKEADYKIDDITELVEILK